MSVPWVLVETDNIQIFFNGNPHDVDESTAIALRDALLVQYPITPPVFDKPTLRIIVDDIAAWSEHDWEEIRQLYNRRGSGRWIKAFE